MSYYDNGQLRSINNYRDGKHTGLRKKYHEKGQLEYSGNWKDRKRDGLWEYFNKDGLVDTEKTGTYKNDVKQ